MTLSLATGELELLDISGERDRPALVLLHEGLGSVGLSRGFPQALAQVTGRRTIAYSRYGHGRSDPPSRPRTPGFMHEEALEVLPKILDVLELEQPVLIGHSDGVSIALIHSAHHPVTAVVAIAPHVFVEEMCLVGIRRARETYINGGLREWMDRHHRDPDAAFYGWSEVWLDPRFPDWDIRPLLGRIRCPLLLIQGEHDQYGTLAQLDAVEHATQAPAHRVVLDCMHAPPIEAPAQTLESIALFLQSRVLKVA